MDAQEIIRYISESEKKTPVRIFIKEKPGACVDYGTAKVFGAGDKIVFGDWKDLKPVLDANAEFIEDLVVENDRRNSGGQSTEKNKTRIVLENSVDQLPSEKPEKLTERFVRGDSARTQKNGGSGIGLAAVKRICEKHHGKLAIDYPDAHIFRVKVEL